MKLVYRLPQEIANKMVEDWVNSKTSTTFFKWINNQLPFPAFVIGTVNGRIRLYLRSNGGMNESEFMQLALSL